MIFFIPSFFLLDLNITDTNLLLSGDINLPLQINANIFAAVYKFINETCRFNQLLFYATLLVVSFQNNFPIPLFWSIKYIQTNTG